MLRRSLSLATVLFAVAALPVESSHSPPPRALSVETLLPRSIDAQTLDTLHANAPDTAITATSGEAVSDTTIETAPNRHLVAWVVGILVALVIIGAIAWYVGMSWFDDGISKNGGGGGTRPTGNTA